MPSASPARSADGSNYFQTRMQLDPVDRRRVAVFLLVAFAVSWATAAVIWRTGGLVDSPTVAGPVTLATVLLTTGYMFGPAVGNVAARLATGEGRSALWLRPGVDDAPWTYVAAWFGPTPLVAASGVLYFLVFPGAFDPGLRRFAGIVESAGTTLDPRAAAALQVLTAVTAAPALNALAAIGEEFGWRAYLLPKLRPLGARRATVAVGVVWGVWHWPIIAMGHNYGLSYPGAPWTGMAAFVIFTVAVGVGLGWVTLREGSVWPATIGHGAINGAAGLPTLLLATDAQPLLGPTPIGLLGVVPFVAVAAWLLARSPVFADDDAAWEPRS